MAAPKMPSSALPPKMASSDLPPKMASSDLPPGIKGKGAATHNEGDWICGDKDCANINFSWRASCNKCGKDKGKVDIIKKTGAEIGKQAAARSGGLFAAEDWQCSVCSNVNWARRGECNVCRTPKFNVSEARTGEYTYCPACTHSCTRN